MSRAEIILKNKAQCKLCKDIVESKHTHDYVRCRCGAIAVDGGTDYLRRSGKTEDTRDLSEVSFFYQNEE